MRRNTAFQRAYLRLATEKRPFPSPKPPFPKKQKLQTIPNSSRPTQQRFEFQECGESPCASNKGGVEAKHLVFLSPFDRRIKMSVRSFAVKAVAATFLLASLAGCGSSNAFAPEEPGIDKTLSPYFTKGKPQNAVGHYFEMTNAEGKPNGVIHIEKYTTRYQDTVGCLTYVSWNSSSMIKHMESDSKSFCRPLPKPAAPGAEAKGPK